MINLLDEGAEHALKFTLFLLLLLVLPLFLGDPHVHREWFVSTELAGVVELLNSLLCTRVLLVHNHSLLVLAMWFLNKPNT